MSQPFTDVLCAKDTRPSSAEITIAMFGHSTVAEQAAWAALPRLLQWVATN